jgi:ubiquinone/menaquinone biosynthesis C-methylase UbiE
MIHGQNELKRAYQDERVAREYVANRFLSPLGALLHDRQVAVLRRLIHRERIRCAVEIAPGPARLTVDVKDLIRALTIVDSSAEMLAEGRRRLAERHLLDGVTFTRGDAFHLTLERTAEMLYSFRLIRHFDRADRVRLYREFVKVVVPKGWVVFDVVNREVSAPIRAANPDEYRHFDALLDADELRAELEEAGIDLHSLHGVQRRFELQHRIQIYLAPRTPRMARACMEVIERLGGPPMEWIAVCRLK